MQRTIFIFLFYLLSTLYFTAHSLQLAITEKEILKAKELLLFDPIIPLLDFKTKVNCGKTCKALYEIIKAKKVVLSSDDSQGLNVYDYTHAMIYYARNNDYSSILFLLRNANKTNSKETERFYKFITGNEYLDYKGKYNEEEILAQYYRGYIASDYDAHQLVLESTMAGNITAFMISLLCYKHNKEIIKAVNNPQEDNTLLHLVKAKTELCNYLISRIDVNIENKLGETPLHYSIKNPGRKQLPPPYANRQLGGSTIYNCRKTECLLNNANIDVNKQNKEGETPLHYAIKYCGHGIYGNLLEVRLNIIQLLLKHPDIKIHVPNNKNETALDYAHKLEREEKSKIIELLMVQNITHTSFFQNYRKVIKVCSFIAFLNMIILAYLYSV